MSSPGKMSNEIQFNRKIFSLNLYLIVIALKNNSIMYIKQKKNYAIKFSRLECKFIDFFTNIYAIYASSWRLFDDFWDS